MDLLTVVRDCFSKDLPIEYFKDKRNKTQSFSDIKYILLEKNLFDKNSKTAYKRKGKGDFYNLMSVCFALKTHHLSIGDYIKESRLYGIEIISTVDRTNLLNFLKGETSIEYTPLICEPIELDVKEFSSEIEKTIKEEVFLVDPTKLLCKEKDFTNISKNISMKILKKLEENSKKDKRVPSSSILEEMSLLVQNKKTKREEIPLILIVSFPGSNFSFESICLFLSEGKLAFSLNKMSTDLVKIKKEKKIYSLVDSPDKMLDEDWKGVVAIVSQKREPWNSSWKNKSSAPVFFFCFEDDTVECSSEYVKISFSKTKRHFDKACFDKFWSFVK